MCHVPYKYCITNDAALIIREVDAITDHFEIALAML